MRNIFCLFVIFLITAGLILSGAEAASADAAPRIILYTCYGLIGEGDEIQIGSIDERGVIRTYSGSYSGSHWPYEAKERLKYLSDAENFSTAGELNHDERFAIQSLIYSVENRGDRSVSQAEDAGTEESYAIRYSADGEAEVILLGKSGESCFENTDPNAQALYLILRQQFPEITNYYNEPFMGPKGFEPIPLAEFTGLDIDAVISAEIRGTYIDCEEGPIPLEMTADEKADLLSLIRSGKVTGKADCLESTGDIYAYDFHDPDGKALGTLMFENGLLVTNDGRYYCK